MRERTSEALHLGTGRYLQKMKWTVERRPSLQSKNNNEMARYEPEVF